MNRGAAAAIKSAPLGPVTLDLAQSIALKQDVRVLVLTGFLDGPKGLPLAQTKYGRSMKLKMLRSFTSRLTTGVFAVEDEDDLCGLVDELQEVGGYQGYVISENGDLDPAYSF